MKKLAISITFLVLLLPLIVIGVLDYKLSEYGVSYKNRVINLKKSSIEFHNMVFKKDDYNFLSINYNFTLPCFISAFSPQFKSCFSKCFLTICRKIGR